MKKLTHRVGEIGKTNNGKLMQIIEYRNNKDIDIKFQDGTIATNKQYHNFINGKVRPPRVIGNIHIDEYAYFFNGEWWCICSCPDWKVGKKILSVSQIYEFSSNKS